MSHFFDRWKRHPWTIVVLGVALLSAILGTWVKISLQDPICEFTICARAPQDVFRLMRLSEQMEQIKQWAPKMACDENVQVVARWIRLSVHSHADSTLDFVSVTGAGDKGRRESAPKLPSALLRDATEPDGSETERIQQLNGFFLFLDQTENCDMKVLRALSLEDRIDRLRRIVESSTRKIQRRAWRKLLEDRQVLDLFDRLQVPSPPEPSEKGQNFVRKLFHKDDVSLLDCWVAAFLKACDRDIRRIQDLYRELEARRELVLGDGPCQLKMCRMRYSGAAAIKFNGPDSTVDMGMWLRKQCGENGMDRIVEDFDTGVRLLGVRLVADDGEFKYDWPTAQIYVDTTQWNRFLHHLGMPGEFFCRDIQVVDNRDKDVSIGVFFNVYHREIATSLGSFNLCFAPGHMEQLEPTVRSLKTRLLCALKIALTECPKYHNLDMQLPVEKGDLKAQFRVSGSLVLDVAILLTEEGKITPVLLADAAAREKIIEAVIEAIPELKKVGPLLRIESLVLRQSPPSLSGEMAILGSSLGMPRDCNQIRWALPVSAQATVAFPPGIEQYLSEVSQQEEILLREVSDVNKQSAIPDIRVAVENHLHVSYPQFDRHIHILELESAPYGTLLSLKLKIGDWPELVLGPTLISSAAEIESKIDFLLGGEQIVQASKKQWQRQSDHPRYGRIQTYLTSFDVSTGKAQAQCCLPIASEHKLELSWQERLRIFQNEWQMPSIEESCREMLPAVEILEQSIAKIIRLSGIDLRVKLDKDAFGPGQWLRWKPFSLYFTAEARLPYFPFTLGVPHILVDEEGLHMPSTLRATYLGTFPLGQYAALSDPMLEVNLDEKSLAIEAKLTPPVVAKSTSRVPGDAWPQMRIDNPWLSVIYLNIRIMGSLSENALGANADLMLLGNMKFASAEGELNMAQKKLQAKLYSNSLVEGFPKFNGAFIIGESEGVRVNADLDLIGCFIKAVFCYEWDRKEIKIEGDVDNLPFIRYCKVKGKADFAFQNCEIKAKGTANLLFVVWHYILHVDKSGCSLTFSKAEEPEVVYVLEGPRADVMEEEWLERQLQIVKDKGAANRKLSEEELKILGEFSPTKSSKPQENPATESNLKALADLIEKEDAKVPKIGVPEGKLQIKKEGNYLRFFTDQPPREFLRVPATALGIGDSDRVSMGLWYSEDDRRALLMWDFEKRQIRVADCKAPGIVTSLMDITGEMTSLGDMFPTEKTFSQKLPQLLRYYRLLHFYSCYKVYGPKPGKVFTCTDGCGFSVEKTVEFFWSNQCRIFHGILPEDRFGRQMSEGFYRRLVQLCPESEDVLFWMLAGHSKVAMLQCPKEPPHLLCLDIEGKGKPLNLYLSEEEDDCVPEVLDYLVDLQWQGKSDFSGLTCYEGPSGAFIFDESRFWVISRNELLAQDTMIHSAPWQDFIDWNRESARFLPDELFTPESRAATPHEKLAGHLVARFEETRKLGWKVSPIGLLIALTQKIEDAR